MKILLLFFVVKNITHIHVLMKSIILFHPVYFISSCLFHFILFISFIFNFFFFSSESVIFILQLFMTYFHSYIISMKPQIQGNICVQITFRNTNQQAIVNGSPVPYITQVQPIIEISAILSSQFQSAQLNSNPKKQTVVLKTRSTFTQIYLLVVHENGGGQSYHIKQHALVSDCIDGILSYVSSYFADVHRQDQCEYINEAQCDCQALLEDVLNGLQTVGSSSFSATGGKVEDVSFNIFKIPVRKNKPS